MLELHHHRPPVLEELLHLRGERVRDQAAFESLPGLHVVRHRRRGGTQREHTVHERREAPFQPGFHREAHGGARERGLTR